MQQYPDLEQAKLNQPPQQPEMAQPLQNIDQQQQQNYNQPPQQNFNQPPQQFQQGVPQGVPMNNMQQGYQAPIIMGQNNQMSNQGSQYPAYANGVQQSITIKCQQCQQVGPTRVNVKTATVPSLAWCAICLCFCCLIQGCCPNTSEYQHFCSHCGMQAGKKEAECI